jgi:hypothetical protein
VFGGGESFLAIVLTFVFVVWVFVLLHVMVNLPL